MMLLEPLPAFIDCLGCVLLGFSSLLSLYCFNNLHNPCTSPIHDKRPLFVLNRILPHAGRECGTCTQVLIAPIS